jgi:gamma-glutamylcyclotransferase (GGCT)/AIG2-like uncharacterized protein YtfP
MNRNNLYFSYGSNLNPDDLKQWCSRHDRPFPLGAAIGKAYLPDMEITFDYYSSSRNGGVLNIRSRLGQVVPGVLFEVLPDGWEMLDQKEGAPNHYHQREVVVLTEDGRKYDAITYEVVSDKRQGQFVLPTKDYVNLVEMGLKAHGLEDTLLKLAAHNQPLPYYVDRLFCYGTLMRGETNYHLLDPDRNIISVMQARLRGRLFELGNFPGMILSESPDQWVSGELFQLREMGKILARLDATEDFEGYGSAGSLYRRAIMRVTVYGAQHYLAWIYLLEHEPRGSVIPSGKWRDRMRRE